MNEIRVIKGKNKDVLVNYINTCSIYIYFYIKLLVEV